MARRLEWLKELDAAHTAAKEQTIPEIKQPCNESFLRCAIPTKVMSDLRNNNFLMVDGVLHDAIKHLFAMTSTVKIEFANRATRQQEDRNQDSCRLSAQRIQIAPYKQKVMQQFGYDELQHSEHTNACARTARTAAVKAAHYDPGFAKPKLPLRGVASESKTPDFHTTSPQLANKQFVHTNFWSPRQNNQVPKVIKLKWLNSQTL